MTLNLLQIATRALDDISSFNAPTFFIGNDDDTAKSLVAAARKVGEELVRDYEWQEMARTGTVTTVDGESLYALEADYDRLASDTMWDESAKRRMGGNTTKRQWAAIKNLPIVGTTQYYWRLYRNQIQLNVPASGVFTFNYEYLSKAYCTDSDGVDRVGGWMDDTDISILPADILIAGVRYYFAKAKNLPYGDAEAEYDAVIQSREGKNTPSQAVDMSAGVVAPGRRRRIRLNIPDRIPT